MNISKKIIAAILSMVVCLSMAACGDSSSSSSSSKADSSAASVAESKAEESTAEESKAEESKAEESVADTETQPAESEAEPVESEAEPVESEAEPVESEAEPVESEAEPEESEAEPEESEAEPDESEAEPEESEAEPDESEAEPAPSGDAGVVKGDGYEVQLPARWMEFESYKTKLTDALKKDGKTLIGFFKPIGVDFAYYNSEDLENTDGVATFCGKAQKNSLFKSVKLADLEAQLTPTVESKYSSVEGLKFEKKTDVKVGGADAIEYDASGTLNGIAFKDRQYVVLNGDLLMTFSFSVPESDYDALSGDIDQILGAVKFTEA
ncbi:MAG: hypothetical protein IKO27_06255 [Ruminococcus sp.]|nr:hypothetical protein [Ruminococcus sp.]